VRSRIPYYTDTNEIKEGYIGYARMLERLSKEPLLICSGFQYWFTVRSVGRKNDDAADICSTAGIAPLRNKYCPATGYGGTMSSALPQGGSIFGIVIGIVIILIGVPGGDGWTSTLGPS